MRFFVGARPTAMGFLKTHLYRDCKSAHGAVLSETKRPLTRICATCQKRYEAEKAANKTA